MIGRKRIAIATLVAPLCFAGLANAQTLTNEQILNACATDQVVETLPNPYTDVTPRDWAYEAVLKMYYCGAYRGAVPPEQYQKFLESQNSSGNSSSPGVSEYIFLTPNPR